MNKNKFSEEQIKTLLNNHNVVKCSNKTITYSKDFKIFAVKQYNEKGRAVNQIFREAGFDPRVIGKYTPQNCLKNWRRVFKTKGIDGLKAESRGRDGGKLGFKGLTDKDRIKRLETENAYLKAENDFLVKLRAGKTE